MLITNEKGVKAQVKKLLDKHSWYWFMPAANGYGKGGISDFLAIKQGAFLAIETKFGGNKPSPMQIGFSNSIRAEKGLAFIVNEKNLGWLASWLESFDGCTEAIVAGEKPKPEHEIELFNATAALSEQL